MVLDVTATISIHAPLTGSDWHYRCGLRMTVHFNPRSPYGERHGNGLQTSKRCHFNPRSPYGERPQSIDLDFSDLGFQSTLPLRGATSLLSVLRLRRVISIHAPLTGSDRRPRCANTGDGNFNPRSPYGERQLGKQLKG